MLHDLISDAVLRMRDHEKWDVMLQREAQDVLTLEEAVEMFGGKPRREEDQDESEKTP